MSWQAAVVQRYRHTLTILKAHGAGSVSRRDLDDAVAGLGALRLGGITRAMIVLAAVAAYYCRYGTKG